MLDRNELHAALQTLTTGFAHELRNPVNAARLQLTVLARELRRGEAGASQLSRIETIDHELDRVSRLLDEFLAFARPSELVLAEHDVAALADDVIATEKPVAEARGVLLEPATAPSTVARVDAIKFRQMLRNLVR